MSVQVMIRSRLRLVVFAAILIGAASTVGAQVERQPRSYRGLFGGSAAPDAASKRQSLDLALSLAAGRDDTTGDGGRGLLDSSASGLLGLRSAFAGGTASLTYGKAWRRTSLSASAASTARYYSTLDGLTALNHSGAIGLSIRLGREASLLLNQSAAYNPYFQFMLFQPVFVLEPGDRTPFDEDLTIGRREAYTLASAARLTTPLGRRRSATFAYQWSRTDFRAADLGDTTGRSAGATLRWSLARSTGLTLGYTYLRGSYSGGAVDVDQRIGSHDARIGFDTTWRHSPTRRTSISAAVGASNGAGYRLLAADAGQVWRGSASTTLSHQLGRAWSIAGVYQRRLDVVGGLPGPVFADGVSASLDGFLGRRLGVSAFGAWSEGTVVSGPVRGTYTTRAVGTGAQYGLHRTLALDARYVYYLYDFDNQALLPAGFPRQFDRHAFRIGCTWWLPLVR
jgi:opacity protein-like surface antigen